MMGEAVPMTPAQEFWQFLCTYHPAFGWIGGPLILVTAFYMLWMYNEIKPKDRGDLISSVVAFTLFAAISTVIIIPYVITTWCYVYSRSWMQEFLRTPIHYRPTHEQMKETAEALIKEIEEMSERVMPQQPLAPSIVEGIEKIRRMEQKESVCPG